MKPFDLEEALAGKPVELADGSKAYVKFKVDDKYTSKNANPHILIGFICDEKEEYEREISWSINGKYFEGLESPSDIVGMWEEPRPTVTLTLPCPLKEPRDEMWFINMYFELQKSEYSKDDLDSYPNKRMQHGGYFASEKDAQEWLDAMKNNRA